MHSRKDAYFTPRRIIPTHWLLAQAQACLVGKEKQFHIKPKAVEHSAFCYGPTHGKPKCLKATLRIRVRHTGGGAYY
jgi:hypothetical protein